MMNPNASKFNSRRSVVVSKNGSVASSNPLASSIGLDVLKAGGNAADAAVAVAAALQVTEPMSTGLGGDAFCMFYDSKSKKVHGLNGSGYAPSNLTLDIVKSQGFQKDGYPMPISHGMAVTVPGAAATWVDTIEKFGSGKISLNEILAPAIELSETGFPVQQIAAHLWALGSGRLQSESNRHGKDLLLNGKTPRHGDLMKNPQLASVFKELSANGKKGFYEGRIAESIVEAVTEHGGVMTLEDMSSYETTVVDPIYTDYKGKRLWEIPPNGQGIVALIALNILEGFNLKDQEYKNTSDSRYLNILMESMRVAFAETFNYCADPSHVKIPLEKLLSKEHAAELRKQINPSSVIDPAKLKAGLIDNPGGSDTVYFTTADKDGNACSFINSNFIGFGTAIVPEGCGFSLQNRACGFSLVPSHPNVLAPKKRPYHTIIPAMLTDSSTGELLMSYGVMGGFMQPQGHVQVLLNMLEFGCNPQEALDLPRFCLGDNYRGIATLDSVMLEEGIPEETLSELKALGHDNISLVTGPNRLQQFGRGQIIARGKWWSEAESPGQELPLLFWSGSDARADGCVAAY